MRTPNHWYAAQPNLGARFTAATLSPLGALYGFAGRLRFALVRPASAGIPVICIGNLTAGGTGKTPLAIMLAHGLAALGRKPHILTRGYRGRLRGPVAVDPGRHTAADVGDEALLLVQAAPTWVARERRAGARCAREAGAEILILDDGFQNPSLKKDVSLLLIDGSAGLGNGCIIPAGPLRESPHRALARADAVVVMGPPSARTQRQLTTWTGPLFHARLEALGPARHGKYLAFAGIGRPEKFFETLEAQGAELVECVALADHHAYTEDEVSSFVGRAKDANARPITTAKDAIRIAPRQRTQIDVLDVTAVVDAQEAFGRFLMDHIAGP